MKKYTAFMFMLFILLGCQREKEKQFTPGSPLYKTAKDLSVKVPFLNPDSNKVLATSDIFTITAASLLHEMSTNMGNDLGSLKELSANELETYIQRYLDSYVTNRLIAAFAEEKGIQVKETQIDSILEHIYQNNGGKENFIDMLRESDLTLQSVINDIKKSLLSERYLKKYVYSDLSITKKELKKVYQQDKTATVRHILLKTQDKNAEEKKAIRQKMQTILAKARQGHNFTALVNQYSQDPDAGQNRGLYENFERGMMVPEFDSAAFAVPIGQISDIIETEYGFHILKVIERKKESRDFDRIKHELERRILSDKKRIAYNKHISNLKKRVNYQQMIDG